MPWYHRTVFALNAELVAAGPVGPDDVGGMGGRHRFESVMTLLIGERQPTADEIELVNARRRKYFKRARRLRAVLKEALAGVDGKGEGT